jgi:transposase InsO family protein
MGKMPNRSYLANPERATCTFEIVHSDLWSTPIQGYCGNKYVMTFLDDFTSHAWTICMKKKSDSTKVLKQFVALVEARYREKIAKFKCNQGGEYMSEEFKNILANAGIELIPSPPRTPQRNGRAERFMRTMAEKMEAMRQHVECPPSWWEFANIHAVHVYNRTPMDRSHQNGGLEHNWLTPVELLEPLIGKPSTKHFRVWGCAAYVYIPVADRTNKFHPKSVLMTYIGYGPSGHMFITKTGAYQESPHAIFDENMFPR